MTDVNGSDELIDHGCTGLVVANQAGAIAAVLEQLVRDDRLRARFREALTHAVCHADARL